MDIGVHGTQRVSIAGTSPRRVASGDVTEMSHNTPDTSARRVSEAPVRRWSAQARIRLVSGPPEPGARAGFRPEAGLRIDSRAHRRWTRASPSRVRTDSVRAARPANMGTVGTRQAYASCRSTRERRGTFHVKPSTPREPAAPRACPRVLPPADRRRRRRQRSGDEGDNGAGAPSTQGRRLSTLTLKATATACFT